MWKKFVQPGRPEMTMWRMHNACWILKVCNPFCFSTAKMVARTRLNITLCTLPVSCFSLHAAEFSNANPQLIHISASLALDCCHHIFHMRAR
jgi:hypothetical protein